MTLFVDGSSKTTNLNSLTLEMGNDGNVAINTKKTVCEMCEFHPNMMGAAVWQFAGLHGAVCGVRPLPHTSGPLQSLDHRRHHAVGARSQVCTRG